MRRPRPAEVAVTLALVTILGAGGAAVASVARDSVGPRELRDGAVRTRDLHRAAVGGRQVRESTLGTVPRAASISRIDASGRVTVPLGAADTRVVTRGPVRVTLGCGVGSGDEIRAELTVTSAAAGTTVIAQNQGLASEIGPGDSPYTAVVTYSAGGLTAAVAVRFGVAVPGGPSMVVVGSLAMNRPGGPQGCDTTLAVLG